MITSFCLPKAHNDSPGASPTPAAVPSLGHILPSDIPPRRITTDIFTCFRWQPSLRLEDYFWRDPCVTASDPPPCMPGAMPKGDRCLGCVFEHQRFEPKACHCACWRWWSSARAQRSSCRVDRVRDDECFHAGCAIDEKCFIPVARKLVNGITADIASVQMIVNLQFPVQIQLLVDELQQPPKTASAHNTPAAPSPFRQCRRRTRCVNTGPCDPFPPYQTLFLVPVNHSYSFAFKRQ